MLVRFLLFASSAVDGRDPLSGDEISPMAPSPDLGIQFFKMLLTFSALILLLFGTYWILRKFIQQRLQRGGGEQAIRILERKAISPKTILYLIEAKDKKILIAESHLEIKRLESFSAHEPE